MSKSRPSGNSRIPQSEVAFSVAATMAVAIAAVNPVPWISHF